MQPRVHTLICSTRPTRVGPVIAKWAHEAAGTHGKFDAHLVDLASFALPVYDEPHHPKLQRYEHEHTRRWSASVDAADALVFVTPEYNHGPTGALLNAMNYLVREWQYKAVGFVSYGGVSGGMRGVQVTKQLLTSLKVVPIFEGVLIPSVTQHIGTDGTFAPNELHTTSAAAMLDELWRWTQALTGLREENRKR